MPVKPTQQSACRMCVLRKGARQVVGSVGPLAAQVLFIGEAPGQEEDKQGEPFVGKTGWELDNLLRLAGLWREQVRLTNLVRCRPPNNRDPKPEEISACQTWLRDELALMIEYGELQLIVPVGRFATRWVLGDVDMERAHGMVFKVPVAGRHPYLESVADTCRVLPVYHPAAGFHNQELAAQIRYDFQAIKRWLGGRWRGVVRDMDRPDGADEYPEPDYQLLTTAADVRGALGSATVVAVDTESEVSDEEGEDAADNTWAGGKKFGDAWCLTFSVKPGQGFQIMATEQKVLGEFQDYLSKPNVLTVLHNGVYDLPVLAEMGIHPAQYTDTMVMAYLLQDEPLGLKPLAYRHAGMHMDSYQDVVGEATERLAVEYMTEAESASSGLPDPDPVINWVKGEPKVKQPQSMHKKIKRALKEYAGGKLDGAGLYKRWFGWGLDEGRREVEQAVGRPMPKPALSHVDPVRARHYACRDADATLRVYPVLWNRVVEEGLQWALERDIGMAPLVLDMMANGIRVDRSKFGELEVELKRRLAELEDQIEAATGEQINPGSPLQTADLLFKKLKLKAVKRTPAGDASTDAKALSRIKDEHPAVKLIMEWREMSKLLTGFVQTLPKLANPVDYRVHTTFRTTAVSTGRLSSSNPNLMNIPTRTELGRQIRNAFVADPGYTFVSGDYSQIEMRVAAHCSADPVLLKVFREGLDIHSQTASRMWGIPVDQLDDKEHRYPAKRVGFGVLYGISPEGLYREMVSSGAQGWTVARCGDLIDSWFGVYEGVKQYMADNLAYARRYQEVRDMWGRRRLIPGVKAVDQRIREEAYRQAGNAPIQSGAQGVIKEAMARLVPLVGLWNQEYADGTEVLPVRALIQIHDDLVWEIREDLVGILVPMIQLVMETALEGAVGAGGRPIGFLVPVKVDFKVGSPWGSMEKYKMAA